MDRALDSLPELFYDLIAIFIPGFYCYYCFSLMYSQETLSNVIGFSAINETLAGLIVIYLLGFIVYFFSSYFIARIFNFILGDPRFLLLGEKPNKRYELVNKYFLSEKSKDIADYYKTNVEKRIRLLMNDKTFTVKNNLDPAYEFCRNYVMEKRNRSTTIRKEQAYGEMSRGIVLVSLVSIIWLLIITIFFGTIITNFWYIFFLYIFSFVTFSFRYGQAKHINPIFIYSTFISVVELKDNKTDEKK